jgi:DNA (cytosine-5)-methyltransferase 1
MGCMKTLAPGLPEPRSTTPVFLDLCAGPGGWDEGARILGLNEHIVGVELNERAAATAVAAGHTRILGDITALRPGDWAHAKSLISSTPCPTFSTSGNRSGVDYQTVLDVITHLGAHDCDCTWGQIQDELGTITDVRTALAAQPARLALSPVMESLEWLVLEQVPAAEFMFEDFAAELFSAGWESVDVGVLDAIDFGMPVRRKRAFLVANRFGTASLPIGLDAPARTMAGALGWGPGERVNTRGAGSSGGNEFSADAASWCLTGSARSWTRVSDGRQLSIEEAAVLQGFRADYPFTGSRTAAFKQVADVVLPPVAAAVLAGAQGLDWEEKVRGYLAGLYDRPVTAAA